MSRATPGIASLRVGTVVHLKKPYGSHATGKLVDIYGMVSAAGIARTKYVLEFPHSRTKTKTVRVAYELEDFLGWGGV